MADLSVTGEVVVTSEKAEAAFDRVGDKATQMANEVAASAGKAGQAVDKIGDGAGASAEKFTRAESRMRDAIKRSTQELQLLGKTASEKLEFNIQAKGLDASKFAPYIEELKKAEQAQKIATGSLDKMGISAAQTAAALRGVPAQFTDIITSLQGGQAPLTVFLQQGGQLKDMFGGAGAAARALGGYVVGLINPFTLAAAGAAALAVAYNQGSKEADAYRLAIVSTGNAVGTTGAQLKSYAQEISGVIGTQGKAAESLAAFVSTGRVSRDVLKEASQAAIAWERATGQAVGATAKQFADLGKDPLQAVLKLNDGTNFLTESVYKQIKSLEEQGKTAEAAAVAQRAWADALTGRAGEIERNLGSIETAWNKVKDAAKGGWDAILNLGRAETNQDKLAATRKQIADLENRLAAGSGFAITSGGAATGRPDAGNNSRLQAELMALKAKEAALFGVTSAERAAAEAQAERAKQTQALAEWDKEGAKYLSDKAKLERDLTKARNEGLAAGKSQAEIEQRLAQIRESYAKKGGSNTASENKELRDQLRVFADLAGVSSTYYAELANYQKQRANGVITEQQYVQAVETLIQKQPFAVAAAKAHAEAIKEEAKAAAESSKALSAWYEVREKESQGLQNQINARREEVSMMGMTTEAVVAYTQAKYEQQAAEKEAYAAALESASFYAGEYAEAYKTAAEAARQQAQQLRELGGLEVEKANREAAKKAKDEWERAADDINRSLTDALLRGFESGKGFAENLRSTLKNMFSTLVLRPIISAALSPVAGAVNGFVGNAVGGAAGSGIGSSIATSIGTSAIGSAFSLGLTNFGTGLGSTLANGVFGGIGTNISNFGTLARAGNLSGALGVAAPYLAGIGAIYAIAKSLDDSGTLHTGGAAQYNAATGLRTSLGFRDNEEGLPSYNPRDNIDNQFGTGFGYVERGDQTIDAVSNLARGLGTALDGVAVAFGQTAGYEIATAFADDTSGDGAWGALRISKDGQDLLNWQDTRTSRWAPREFGDGEEGYKQYLAAVAKDTRQVLLDMDLPSWADKMLTSIGDSASMEQLTGVLNQIGVVQSAFVGLGNSMEMFANLSDEMQSGLLAAAGSIDALTAGAGAFYQGFYSEQERFDSLTKQLNETLAGLDLSIDPRLGDDAKEQFRAAVEAAFAAGDAELAASLLAISGNFATAADYFEQLSQSAADAAAQAERSAAEQASIAGDLRRQIYELNGDTAAIRQIEIAGMNAANIALYDRVQALQAEAQQTAIRADLERQLLELQGDTVALRKLDIASMDAYNVALYDQIQARKAAERDRQAALDEVDAAYSALQRSIDVQRSVAQEVINDTRAVFETLRSNVRSLYGDVGSTSAMQAGQGRDYITQALASARATGYLPDNQDLQEAIGAVRRDIQSRVYASQAESDYERLVLAAELKDLQDLSGDQLTEAEKQLKALDGILDNARAQVDALKGINTSVMSVEDAIANLANALTMAKAIGAGAGGAGGAMGPGGKPVGEYLAQVTPDMLKGYTQDQIRGTNDRVFNATWDIKQAWQSGDYAAVADLVNRSGMSQAGIKNTFGLSDANLAYVNSLGIMGVDPTQAAAGHDIVLSGGTATNTAQSALFNALAQQGKAALAAGNEAGIYAEAAARGLDSGDVDALLGLPAGSAEEWARKAGLPVLRVGTNYVPADGLAYLHEGEAIVPKAYNPSAGGMQSNGKLESLVEALTAEVKRLQAIVNDGNREQRRTANAVNGNPDMPMLVQTV